ncbi:phage/plasmid primase, P4 family [Paenarthrobacter sp. YIM B13468]|uniref:DNA primase family protein n=1 Tax=Paenarthrobacter sp. YIM B13468 TaxID=3366295 RepID=UPI00366C7F1A
MTDTQNNIAMTVEKWRLAEVSKHTLAGKADYSKLAGAVPLTDLDAARTLAQIFEHHLTFIPHSTNGGDWYVWNGIVHSKDERGLVDDYLATEFANALKATADYATNYLNNSTMSDEDKAAARKGMAELFRYAKSIRSAGGLKNLKTRIRYEFQQAPEFFDHDQRWAVMSDGRVIDLENIDAEPLAPSPKLPVSRHLGVTQTGSWLSPETYPKKWGQALSDWTPDEGVQDYLRIAAGAALLGKGDAKNIVTLVGLSHTGKSTYINVLREVFGTYAGELPPTAIVQKYGGAANFEQHKARGKRFLYLSEPQKQRTDDAFLKALAGGGDTITTSKKGQDGVEWQAQCVLHIAANHIPKFDTTDNAIVGRMNIVGFDHVFEPDAMDRNKNLVRELIDQEGSGIMFWILAGAREYLEIGHIPVPESIRKRSQENVVESSAPLMWLNDMVESGVLVIDKHAYMSDMMTPKDAYPMFQNWCFENGEPSVKQKDWLKDIEAFNKMPADRKGKRPGGHARVWGVRKSAVLESRKLHLGETREELDFRDLMNQLETAPQVQ